MTSKNNVYISRTGSYIIIPGTQFAIQIFQNCIVEYNIYSRKKEVLFKFNSKGCFKKFSSSLNTSSFRINANIVYSDLSYKINIIRQNKYSNIYINDNLLKSFKVLYSQENKGCITDIDFQSKQPKKLDKIDKERDVRILAKYIIFCGNIIPENTSTESSSISEEDIKICWNDNIKDMLTPLPSPYNFGSSRLSAKHCTENISKLSKNLQNSICKYSKNILHIPIRKISPKMKNYKFSFSCQHFSMRSIIRNWHIVKVTISPKVNKKIKIQTSYKEFRVEQQGNISIQSDATIYLKDKTKITLDRFS